MFTLENTKDFDQETLDKMNEELKKELECYGIENEEDYPDLYQYASEKVFNKFC